MGRMESEKMKIIVNVNYKRVDWNVMTNQQSHNIIVRYTYTNKVNYLYTCICVSTHMTTQYFNGKFKRNKKSFPIYKSGCCGFM